MGASMPGAASENRRLGSLFLLNTLGAVIGELLAAQEAAPPPAAQQTAPSSAAPACRAAGETAAEVGRYVVRARPLPLPGGSATALRGLHLVTGEGEVASRVAAALRERGAAVALLPPRALASAQAVKESVAEARASHGPVAGIVHLAGLAEMPLPQKLEAWREQTQLQTKSLFQLVQACGAEVQKRSGLVLAASRLGGGYGPDVLPGPGLPCAAGAGGLLKTALIEWPGLRGKTVDFDASSPEATAAALVA